MPKLRWGILGVANINNRVLPAFARTEHAELRAIASRSLKRAKAAAAAAGIPNAHGNYDALLDDPAVDVIYNPLPNTLHADWTMKAAERGKHVLCEKPLATTAAQAEKVVEWCEEQGVRLMDGFMWPHHPRTGRLRKLLDSRLLGEIRRVSGAFTFPLRPLDSSNIRLQADLGGGSLLDVGCYPVYGIRWAFAAEPVRAYATATYRDGVDIEMNGTLWFAHGQMATFDCGFTLPLRGWLEITGTDGVLSIPEMWLPSRRASFIVQPIDEAAGEFAVEGKDQIVHMIDNFSRAILRKEPVNPPPQEAVRTLRVLDALAKSAREDRVVTV
jgi:xylose dehydrogenase (NAD/NADP)